MIPFHIPATFDLSPVPGFTRRVVATDEQRSAAMDDILGACGDFLDEETAVKYALDRGYSIREITTSYFYQRFDEARAVAGVS